MQEAHGEHEQPRGEHEQPRGDKQRRVTEGETRLAVTWLMVAFTARALLLACC